MAEVKPRIRLVRYTANPERAIADAARVCYADDEGISKLFSSEGDSSDDSRMIKNLVEMGHTSPLEFAEWTFFVQGISRALSHQLVRHRVASYAQRSQRYVRQGNFDYVIPELVEKAHLEEEFAEMMKDAGKNYDTLIAKIKEKTGLDGEHVNQDARFVLPNACETKITIKMNGRQLVEVFFNERLCNRAQWEIRAMAREMHKLAYPTAPTLFSYVGPACYREGKCHQKKKCCGKMQEIKSYFDGFKRA